MRKYLPFFCLLLLFSCDKEKETRMSSLQPPVITGYNFINNNGMPLQSVGNPNVKTSVKNGDAQFEIIAYPNPAVYAISIQWRSGNPISKASFWIVAAQQDESLNSFNFMQATFPIVGGQPLMEIELEPGPFQQNIQIDLQTLPAGAYRLYAQFDDVLLWDNILKIN